jgi:hypothetical protein
VPVTVELFSPRHSQFLFFSDSRFATVQAQRKAEKARFQQEAGKLQTRLLGAMRRLVYVADQLTSKNAVLKERDAYINRLEHQLVQAHRVGAASKPPAAAPAGRHSTADCEVQCNLPLATGGVRHSAASSVPGYSLRQVAARLGVANVLDSLETTRIDLGTSAPSYQLDDASSTTSVLQTPTSAVCKPQRSRTSRHTEGGLPLCGAMPQASPPFTTPPCQRRDAGRPAVAVQRHIGLRQARPGMGSCPRARAEVHNGTSPRARVCQWPEASPIHGPRASDTPRKPAAQQGRLRGATTPADHVHGEFGCSRLQVREEQQVMQGQEGEHSVFEETTLDAQDWDAAERERLSSRRHDVQQEGGRTGTSVDLGNRPDVQGSQTSGVLPPRLSCSVWPWKIPKYSALPGVATCG